MTDPNDVGLSPNENLLVGQWVTQDNRVVEDAVCMRIRWLIADKLKRVANENSGWSVLFLDPLDGRLWELSYSHSEWHGDGPPKLEFVSADLAKTRYGHIAN
jgi:Immunity protein 27